MKKILVLCLAALFLCCGTAAFAQQEAACPVVLDTSTMIDGNLVYYSGSVDGGESGVFVMSTDGSQTRKLVDAENMSYSLLAISGGNLMAFQNDYRTENPVDTLVVIKPDGTVIPVECAGYPGGVIAADGRFYWGMGSCDENGGDVQRYFETDNAYEYCPVALSNGYYYYLDWTEMSGSVFTEGTDQPMGASLCRMNLSDRTSEVISGLGTNYLGMDDARIYYTRTSFWTYAEDSEPSEVVVDEGLFCADLASLEETRLASYAQGSEADAVVDSYQFLADGIIYGTHSYFPENGNGEYSILRVSVDGTALPSIPVTDGAWALGCVQEGKLYISQCNIETTEDDFIQKDTISAIDLETGAQTTINPDSTDILFYAEGDPSIAVVNGRVYFTAYDMERWSVCLKSIALDGSDLKTLAQGVSYAEG